VIGLAVGAALVVVLIWLPAAISGDYYEITDPLVFMGMPIVVFSVAIDALIGVPAARVPADDPAQKARRPSRTSKTFVAIVAVTGAVLATWFFLRATGAVDASFPDLR
jgi:hypothetical protein